MDNKCEKGGQCAFDTLFANSVPHLLEKIFFSLDYTSFKNCLEVKNTWNELLTSGSFLQRARTLFKKEILDDEMSLQHASRKGKADEEDSDREKLTQFGVAGAVQRSETAKNEMEDCLKRLRQSRQRRRIELQLRAAGGRPKRKQRLLRKRSKSMLLLSRMELLARR